MTPQKYAELARLEAAAMKGPWEAAHIPDSERYIVLSTAGDEVEVSGLASETNAVFIAAARDAVPTLLAENERLRMALRQIADTDSLAGGWDGWRENERLRDIARAALVEPEP